jgi:hypothetical protein
VKENRNYNGTENWNYNQIALNVSTISKVFVSRAEKLVALRHTSCCKERRICVYIGFRKWQVLLFLTSQELWIGQQKVWYLSEE